MTTAKHAPALIWLLVSQGCYAPTNLDTAPPSTLPATPMSAAPSVAVLTAPSVMQTTKPSSSPSIISPLILNDLVAPKTGRKGQPVEIQLWVSVGDSCGTFPDAGAEVDEANKSVSFWGRIGSDAGLGKGGCAPLVYCRSRTISFTPMSAGTYTLNVRWRSIASVDCQEFWLESAPKIIDSEHHEGTHPTYNLRYFMEISN